MSAIIKIDKSIFQKIREHLLQNHLEQVCFLYFTCNTVGTTLVMEVVDNYFVVPDEYEYQSGFHVELKDTCQAKVIKTAWDKKLSLGEIHSHPTSHRAVFSGSDVVGFHEFVPHVWWRLKKGPYFAIILAKKGVDALVWVKSPEVSEPVDIMKIGFRIIYPSNATINSMRGIHGKQFF
jgi:hypothetical protein